MWIWKFEAVTKWTYHGDEDGEIDNISIVAEDFDKAYEKFKKFVLSKKRKIENDYPISTDVVNVERLDEWVDA